jgi:hypothetical protein
MFIPSWFQAQEKRGGLGASSVILPRTTVWNLKTSCESQKKGRTIRTNGKGNGKGITIPALEYGKPERCTDMMETVNWRQVAQNRNGWRSANREALILLG